jgi:hypothetical protein
MSLHFGRHADFSSEMSRIFFLSVRQLGLPHEIKFCSETNSKCRKFLQLQHGVSTILEDGNTIIYNNNAELPGDVF